MIGYWFWILDIRRTFNYNGCTFGGDDVQENSKKDAQIRTCLARVEEILRCEMQFGTVTIIVQNGVPIQIDKTEKQRFS